jgi:Putative undecaprenyl diphosphate synthase
MPDNATYEGLAHVVVAGGTPQEWLSMSTEQWAIRISTLLEGASIEGVQWITLLPHHGNALSGPERELLRKDLRQVDTVLVGHGERYVTRNDAGTVVIVDPSPDGHARLAATVEALRVSGVDPDTIDEESLSLAILAPAVAEPDLVIILGPPDLIPESMVWELAYSELVFLDLGWDDLTASDLELAIDDFTRRHRRFGGLDS